MDSQNNQGNVLCRIWAWEEDPSTLEGHHCHAEFHGFKGGMHPKDDIERILAETPVECSRMRWTLKACEPMNDGSACEGCQYQPYKGLSYIYDS